MHVFDMFQGVVHKFVFLATSCRFNVQYLQQSLKVEIRFLQFV